MKLQVLLAVALVAVTTAFKPAAKVETFKIDPAASKVEWEGKKVAGKHNGQIKIQSGTLLLNGNNLAGGTFKLDMNSISCTDLEGEYAQKLVGHLKNDDFFGTDKYPTSDFVITKVTAAGAGKINVTGNLTIKGATHPISFAANVARSGKKVTATATNIPVDRTKYDVRYGSKSFFSSIGDKAIDDIFTLNVTLVAAQ